MDRLRILHLEDDPADAELIAATLAADGIVCNCTRASSRAQFVAALDQPWDLILGDFAIPGFDGVSAQQIARERRPDTPFLFVSGTMGEEVAIERLKAGATDYVLKQRLGRLPAAVRRAMDEAQERRARRGLEEAVDFLDHLIAASPSIIFRFEPDGLRTTFASPNIGWLLGYSQEEVMGAPGFWTEIIHPEDRERVLECLRTAMEGTVAQIEQEYRLRSKDGRYRWFFNLLRIDYDAATNPVAVLGYALDISDRKAAEEELQRAHLFLDSVVEHLPVVLAVKNAGDLRYVRLNRAGEDMLGIDRSDVIGRSAADVFPAALAEQFDASDRTVLSTGAVVDIPEETFATRSRGARVLHTRKIPIFDEFGKPLYLLGISEDITDRKAAQEGSRLAKLEAERASRAKSEFLSRMSHDLRTPLNAILGFAQLLEMDRLGVEQADSVHQILQGGAHLLELVNEVLDIARIEAGHLALSPEPVSLLEVIHEVVSLVRPLGVARAITLRTDPGVDPAIHVLADRQRVKQVLVNLLGNAVKYNTNGGTVTVTAAVSGGRVRVSVTDTGAGIPAQKLPLLFQPFERLGAEQGPVEGTGLGLAVSKGLIEAMGGTIGAQSHPGGSTFWIDLAQIGPPQNGREESAAVTTTAPGAGTAGTVLYIEDNRSNIRLLERLLARRPGVRLLTESTGEGALNRAHREHADLILLDLHLPDMAGEDVLLRLLAETATAAIPVAILSADATSQQSKRLLAAGAVAYLTKPLQLNLLLQLLERHLPERQENARS